MPKLGSRGSLERRLGYIRGVFYRHGSRFSFNLGTTDKAEAKKRLKQLIQDCEEANVLRPEKSVPSIAALLNEVEQHYERHARRNLRNAVRHIATLKAFFKGRSAAELDRQRINRFVDKRRAEGYANGSINRELSVLQLGYRLAVKDRRITADLMPHFELLPEAAPRKGFFEPEEYQALLQHLPSYLQGVLTFGYWVGLRREEALGLRWHQVDLVNRQVELERTKNGEDRVVVMGTELYTMFTKQWEDRWEGCDFVFHKGPQRIPQSLSWHWNRAAVKAGIGRWVEVEVKGKKKLVCQGRLYHDLRRTAARNMIRSGTPQSVAMRITGHKSPSMFARYNVVDTRDLKAAMIRLEEYENQRRREREERDAMLTEGDRAPQKPSRVQ